MIDIVHVCRLDYIAAELVISSIDVDVVACARLAMRACVRACVRAMRACDACVRCVKYNRHTHECYPYENEH